MNINQLKYAVKIAECLSISLAARQLFISQPSLSKSINELEKEYGIKIFNRTRCGVSLTPQGKSFLDGARNVLAAANILDQTFTDRDSEQRLQLFIASQQLDFLYDLILQTYADNQDRVVFSNIVETDRSSVVRLILDKDVDLGIIVRTSNDIKNRIWDIEAKRLEFHLLDRAGVYASIGPESPYYHRDRITFPEAENCPQIALDLEENAKHDYFFNRLDSYFNRKSLVFLNSIGACKRFLTETDVLLFNAKWAAGCFSDTPIRTIPVVPGKGSQANPITTELLWLKRAGEPLNATETQFVRKLTDHFAGSGSPLAIAGST